MRFLLQSERVREEKRQKERKEVTLNKFYMQTYNSDNEQIKTLYIYIFNRNI